MVVQFPNTGGCGGTVKVTIGSATEAEFKADLELRRQFELARPRHEKPHAGAHFRRRSGLKIFLSRQRTRCAGVIFADGFLAVAELSHGASKAEPWWPGDAGCRQAVRQRAGQPIGASGCHRALLSGGLMKPSTSWREDIHGSALQLGQHLLKLLDRDALLAVF